MNHKISLLKKQIQGIILFYMAALIVSGATAIPVYTEMRFLINHLPENIFGYSWLQKVFIAIETTEQNFPFLLYGYDWLAFAHFVIAVAFIGPLRNPVKNSWVIEFGMIACLLIIPYAFTFCMFRGIPLWWALIDSSFGIFGFIPLWICHRKIQQLEQLMEEDKLNVIF